MGGLGWVLVLASWVRFGWVHKLMGLVGLGEQNGFTSISALNSTKKLLQGPVFRRGDND